MTPDEKNLLEKTYALTEKNNEILVSLRRKATASTIVRVIYWTVIIAASLGAYYFIQPYVKFLSNVSSQAGNNAQEVKSLTDKLGDILK